MQFVYYLNLKIKLKIISMLYVYLKFATIWSIFYNILNTIILIIKQSFTKPKLLIAEFITYNTCNSYTYSQLSKIRTLGDQGLGKLYIFADYVNIYIRN